MVATDFRLQARRAGCGSRGRGDQRGERLAGVPPFVTAERTAGAAFETDAARRGHFFGLAGAGAASAALAGRSFSSACSSALPRRFMRRIFPSWSTRYVVGIDSTP